ncbi:ABC transporter ATP-binding protein [Leifsonia sp. Root227]|uniref:ABC transporter ATP-binding protein n=1 Tax=Leifsonia sp. Root227 TaxID=1736496 RepID=UPI0009E8D2BE|nr:ABC transporter ATP-binding protein [Leifsonia sp. Root227]
MSDPTSPLQTAGATLGYDGRVISDGIDVAIPAGSFTVIVGPNAGGKSTLLRGLARLLKPSSGQVLLDGRDIHGMRTKEVARRLGLLPQTSLAPDGITVADLVARGRHPHQSTFQQWTRADQDAVRDAMLATGITELSARRVDELSGGQRQRAWVALALAQQTGILLLDEPTTFLDIAHQFELLELFRGLNEEGRTLVAVLHDLNQASRYASHIIAMNDGRVVAQGTPEEVITADLVHDVFGLPAHILPDPVAGTPLVVPLGPPGRVFERRPATLIPVSPENRQETA